MYGEDNGKPKMFCDLFEAGQNFCKTTGIINIFSTVGSNKEISLWFKIKIFERMHFLLCNRDVLPYRIYNGIPGYRDFFCSNAFFEQILTGQFRRSE